MTRIEQAYDQWIEENSTNDNIRQLAAYIIYHTLKEAIQTPKHRHLFLNRFFINSLISTMVETLKPWPEEVAAWRFTLGMTEEMDLDGRLAS